MMPIIALPFIIAFAVALVVSGYLAGRRSERRSRKIILTTDDEVAAMSRRTRMS